MAVTSETLETVRSVTGGEYKYGFVTDIESDFAPRGLNEDIVRFISAKKEEPDWLFQWRLKAYRSWPKLADEEPKSSKVLYPPIDFQDSYY